MIPQYPDRGNPRSIFPTEPPRFRWQHLVPRASTELNRGTQLLASAFFRGIQQNTSKGGPLRISLASLLVMGALGGFTVGREKDPAGIKGKSVSTTLPIRPRLGMRE
jgi:hypothetical protein